MLSVVEKFVSINGEGKRAGELAAFIRFKGCNLNCSYCDTKWANQPDAASTSCTVAELAGWVKSSGIKNVTLTGGEPLLQNEIAELTEVLLAQGNRVELETNGSVSLKTLAPLKKRPVFTMDYKLPSSGMEGFMLTENFDYLNGADSVKFVSGSISDLERAVEIINKYSLLEKCSVFISPVFGKIKPSEIVEFMKDRGMNEVRLQLQLHKFIWEPTRRGV